MLVYDVDDDNNYFCLCISGLGVMLVIVVGIGWRCTPTGHEPCHLLFNLGEHSTRDISRGGRAARLRDRHQWWGGKSSMTRLWDQLRETFRNA